MRQFFLFTLLLPVAFISKSQPGCDLFLFKIQGNGDTIRFEFVKNLTQRSGYDNQPSFSPDGRYVYYSAKYKLTHDIYRYDLQNDKTVNISKSPYSSEFSPMVMPDGVNLSAVFIEEDSVTQRIWKVAIAGGKSKLIDRKIDSVGYYWPLGGDEYAAFILGTNEVNHSLRIINTGTHAEEYVTDSIRGCIRTIPGTRLISFVKQNKHENRSVIVYDRSTKSLKKVLDLPQGSDDYVWIDQYLLVPIKNRLEVYKFDEKTRSLSSMIVERDLSESAIKNARRPAISPDLKQLILVGDDLE